MSEGRKRAWLIFWTAIVVTHVALLYTADDGVGILPITLTSGAAWLGYEVAT